jgi:hypothetical protein
MLKKFKTLLNSFSYSKDHYEFFSYTFNKIEGENFPLNDSELTDMAKIIIKYSSTEYTVNQKDPVMLFVEYVCFVGGLMGMYIGISFVTIYDIAVEILLRTYKTFKTAHK